MISRTVLAFLFLNGLIVHVHIRVLDRGDVFVPKQFLEAEWIIAERQVANGKGMAQDLWTDVLVGDPSTFAERTLTSLNAQGRSAHGN